MWFAKLHTLLTLAIASTVAFNLWRSETGFFRYCLLVGGFLWGCVFTQLVLIAIAFVGTGLAFLLLGITPNESFQFLQNKLNVK